MHSKMNYVGMILFTSKLHHIQEGKGFRFLLPHFKVLEVAIYINKFQQTN